MKRTKKLGIILLAMAISMLTLFTGCKGKTKEIDAEATLNALLNDVKYESELAEVSNNAAMYFPDLPEKSTIKLYRAGGYSAEEVALITVVDEKDTDKVKEIINQHIKETRDQFMNYQPKEVSKIDNAVVSANGRYVFLCITDDFATAKDILKAPKTQADANDKNTTGKQDTELTKKPASNENYPRLVSKSGEVHEYGKNAFAIRVDNKAYSDYAYVNSAVENYATVVNKTAKALENKVKVYDLVIPTAIGITLPDDVVDKTRGYVNQAEAIENIFKKMDKSVIPVNCYDNMMRHRDEYLYFGTDYHWNGKGAYYAYEAFCKTKGVKPVTLEERELKKFDGFLGALYWKNCKEDPVLKENPDTVEAYLPKSKTATMKYTDTKGQTYDWPIIYDVTEWKASTKYSAFAGADNPISVFTNPEVKDGSVCVVVKESFGNALLPFLVDNYSTIYEIDYRYWKGDLVKFALENKANDLIFANNLEMISTNMLVGQLAGIVG